MNNYKAYKPEWLTQGTRILPIALESSIVDYHIPSHILSKLENRSSCKIDHGHVCWKFWTKRQFIVDHNRSLLEIAIRSLQNKWVSHYCIKKKGGELTLSPISILGHKSFSTRQQLYIIWQDIKFICKSKSNYQKVRIEPNSNYIRPESVPKLWFNIIQFLVLNHEMLAPCRIYLLVGI